jgi:septal ring factor EnvC (AmiA/AmiB activator)
VSPLRKIAALLVVAGSGAWPLMAQQGAGGAGGAPQAQGTQSPEQRLRTEQSELDQIRSERSQLEERLSQLRGNVHTLSDEIENLDHQTDVTARAVHTLDRQLGEITTEMSTSTGQLVQDEDQIAIYRAVLHRRLIDLYKQGPLYTMEALLTADSFGALIARYKYLHLLVLHDQALVTRVELLRDHIEQQRHLLSGLHDAVVENRSEKAAEQDRLQRLEAQRRVSLVEAKRSQEEISARLKRIASSEARVESVISSVETERRKEEARPNAGAPSGSTILEGDRGRLNWPVNGSILYRFGRVVNPNNTTTRWNGIGIQVDAGTQVHAVAAGRVMVARTIGTYGPTVIVQHGGGDYSVYGSLGHIDVVAGQRIDRGTVVGEVGQSDPDLPPHLHFEIRRQEGQAVDPLDWLRGGAGAGGP